MSNQPKKTAAQARLEYKKTAQSRDPGRPVLRNALRAFLVGGLICVLGQAIQTMLITVFGFDEQTVGNPTVAVLIILSVLLTGLGVYDQIAQWSGAGTGVPVTGFANSIASAAIEHRSEGWVLGVAGQMFKIAGCVIVYGVFAAFVVALVKLFIHSLSLR